MDSEQLWGADYIKLAWSIHNQLLRKFPETEEDAPFVDSYYGPNEFKSFRNKDDLRELCYKLMISIPTENKDRYEYLSSQLQAMDAVIGIINDEKLPYLDRVERIFGIRPEFFRIDPLDEEDTKFINRISGEFIVPIDKLISDSQKILEYCEKITREKLDFLSIPDGNVEIKLVGNRSWGAYNWYDGELSSRIEMNKDVGMPYLKLIRAIAHETFPGHHLEHSIKEKELYLDRGFLESSIILTLAPESTISEGIARNAWKIIFGDLEGVLNFSDENFGTNYCDFGIENIVKSFELLQQRSLALANPAIMMHDRGEGKDEIVKYRQDYLGLKKSQASNLDFIKSPIWRYYIFNYGHGENLVRDVIWTNGKLNKEAVTALYTRQVTPGILQKLI